jgi:cobalt-zinc-cadmium efflux system outer membrane protein
LNRRVLDESVRVQSMELEIQRRRVATDVSVKFQEALAAQKCLAAIEEFLPQANKGMELAELRKKAAEGSQIDVLQARVQLNEIQLARRQAEAVLAAHWRELDALVGWTGAERPRMAEKPRLLGSLPEQPFTLDWGTVAADIVARSPECSAAHQRVLRAQAELNRQLVQSIPNWNVQLGVGADNGTNSQMINVQLGAPIPIHNQNQGNIAAARAELCRATLEVQRVEQSIRARLAGVSGDYDSAAAAVQQYSQDILPSAQRSLELAEVAYKAGETSFVQVLVARRTYFDAQLQYIAAQSLLAQANAKLEGYLLANGLDPIIDRSGDDSLRGASFGLQ